MKIKIVLDSTEEITMCCTSVLFRTNKNEIILYFLDAKQLLFALKGIMDMEKYIHKMRIYSLDGERERYCMEIEGIKEHLNILVSE